MTAFDRRQFLRLNAAALAGAALAPVAAAGRKPGPGARAARGSAPIGPPDSSPGFYRFALGDTEITVLSDGHFHFPMELLAVDTHPTEFLAFNAEPEKREEYFESRLVPSDHVPLQVSPVLIDAGGRRVLVDSGWNGEQKPPATGRLNPSLDAVGATPESIDTVILTHGHPDHLGGLVDPATGAPVFPNAEIVISEGELAFWTDEDTGPALDEVLADGPGFLAGMQAVLGAVDDRIRPIRAGEEVVPGIRSIPSPGHTPGHICLGMESGGEQLLLTGDAITNTHAAFEHPEWEVFVDADRELAGRTRGRLLDRAATDEMLILGYHFPFPGLGYALEYGDAYRWHPAGWMVLT